jgi:hypothetical protein
LFVDGLLVFSAFSGNVIPFLNLRNVLLIIYRP